MNEHTKTTYTTLEETKHIASEDAVAYNAPQAAPQHISNADALWTLIQSQDENTKGELRYRLDRQSANKEALRLDQDLEEILHDDELKNAGMAPVSASIVRNVRAFIRNCPNEDILRKAMLQPRMNGTLLLDWYQSDYEATVNIGEDSWSYGIMGHSDNKEQSGEAPCSDDQAVLAFYNAIKPYMQ